MKKNKWAKVNIIGTGLEVADVFIEIYEGDYKFYVYNICLQQSELKYTKRNLKENEVILSVDFSKNYENNQKNEIQSTYFGHEACTSYPAACHFKEEWPGAKRQPDCDLYMLPVVMVSNETQYERNIAYSCNIKLLNFILEKLPNINQIFFWSDGLASQFRSRYVFYSFLSHSQDVTLSWNYGGANHFKGPHDGIGGSVKRKVYQDVSSKRIVTTSAKDFVQYANEVCNSVIFYLDKTDTTEVDVTNVVYIPGTL